MKDETRFLWELLVPRTMKGSKVTKKHHEIFDKFVYKFSNGLTIFPASKGSWASWTHGELVKEEVLPVRFICTQKDLEKIGKFARKHYEQEAIFACLVSEKIFLFGK